MILLYTTIVTSLVLRVIGFLGVRVLDGWRASTRAAMGIFFCFTGINHFTAVRADLINMVPPSFPDPGLLVTISGVAEILGGLGLFIPRLARPDAIALIVMLIVLFPANIYAAQHGILVAGAKHPALLPRTIMQVAWIAMIWWSRASRPRLQLM